MALIPWDTLADRAIVASRDQFGVSVEYPTGSGHIIRAPFDDAHTRTQIVDGLPVTTTAPVIDVRLADLANPPAQGDRITVAGRAAEVRDVWPSGRGCCKLPLWLDDEVSP